MIEEIYQAYPRHRDKRAAFIAIGKAIERVMRGETGKLMFQADAEAYLLSRSKAFANSFAGQRGCLTAYPATWFNRGGYMDDDHEWDLMSREEYEEAMQSHRANVGVWRPH